MHRPKIWTFFRAMLSVLPTIISIHILILILLISLGSKSPLSFFFAITTAVGESEGIVYVCVPSLDHNLLIYHYVSYFWCIHVTHHLSNLALPKFGLYMHLGQREINRWWWHPGLEIKIKQLPSLQKLCVVLMHLLKTQDILYQGHWTHDSWNNLLDIIFNILSNK